MKIVGLISGGKDSIANLLECVAHGHEIVCLANLHGQNQGQELDSFMYQTVGVEIVPYIAQCMELPLITHQITGKSICKDLYYEKQGEQDEVEDLCALLTKVKEKYPEVQGVASGAIFSNYQRLRVENVCQRLGLFSLAYLWLRDQTELLGEMIQSEIDGRIVKVACMGLKKAHLGKSITELQPIFTQLKQQFDFNECGEGGEYESAVFDCPLFKKQRIQVDQSTIVDLGDGGGAFIEVASLALNSLVVEPKDAETQSRHKQIMEDRSKAVKEFQGEETKLDFEKFVQDQTRQVEPEELKIQPMTQTTLKLGDAFYFSGAVRSRIKRDGERNLESDMDDLTDILANLESQLKERGMNLAQNGIYVDLKVRDMAQFATLNKLYINSFGLKPPVRVCVQPTQPEDGQVSMSVLALASSRLGTRQNLHVQSFSKWAPANIGPYSQANLIGQNEVVMLAGQIGLNPGLMTLRPSLSDQLIQIIVNYNSTIKEAIQNKDKNPDLIQKTVGKIILSIGSMKFSILRSELLQPSIH